MDQIRGLSGQPAQITLSCRIILMNLTYIELNAINSLKT